MIIVFNTAIDQSLLYRYDKSIPILKTYPLDARQKGNTITGHSLHKDDDGFKGPLHEPNMIFLWHNSVAIHKTWLFLNFPSLWMLCFKCLWAMHDLCIDYCVYFLNVTIWFVPIQWLFHKTNISATMFIYYTDNLSMLSTEDST